MRRAIALLTLVFSGCLSSLGPNASSAAEREAAENAALPGDALTRGILWHKEYPTLRVMIHAADGQEPSPATASGVQEALAELLDKTVEVQVIGLKTAATRETQWQPKDLEPFIAAAKAEPWPAGVALVHVYALPGCYNITGSDPTRGCIQGITPQRVAFVMMDSKHTVRQAPLDEPLAGPTRDVPWLGWYEAERWLYVHELGHVIGLVETPLPQVHDRLSELACTCHSTDPDSVMYEYAQSIDFGPDAGTLERLQDDELETYTFAVDDIADVRAFQALEG